MQIIPPFPVSCISEHKLSLFSVLFFTFIKKIQIYYYYVNCTQCHTYITMTSLDLVLDLINFHVQFCSNVAVEIWVLPKNFSKSVITDKLSTLYIFDLLELCA